MGVATRICLYKADGNSAQWLLVEKAITAMEELIRTNNVVTLSFVGTLLKEAGIQHFVADENMSVMDGSINALSRRLMVDSERIEEARRLVEGAGLGAELRHRD